MEKKYTIKSVLTLMLFASALTCLVITLIIVCFYDIKKAPSNSVSEYATLLDMIGELYIGEYDEYTVNSTAMKAAVESLGDNWSYYMTPDEYANFLDVSNNRYAGIGVGIVSDEQTGGMIVHYIYRGSPAETAGIAVGDVILAIDGEDIKGYTIDDIRVRLSRPIGETADIMIMHPDGSIAVIVVAYDYVFIDPVSFEMLDDRIGYIAVMNFDHGAAESFISAIDELIGQGARAFVFDVRNNGGGRVVEMTGMLDYLLPEGEIFITVDRSGEESITRSDADSIDMPCVVLVDCYSFSAAEYFAATLREYEYALVVGEQTTGKSRMQTTYNMPGGGALHISTSQYLTKNRVKLHDIGGLTPDYQIILTDEEFSLFLSGALEMDDDPQLQQALSLLSS